MRCFVKVMKTIPVLFLSFSGIVHAENYPGVVKKYDLQLTEDLQFSVKKQPVKKNFHDADIEGWVKDSGDWYIKGMVTHNRLRCATYQLGVQLGKGNPACTNVQWLSGVQYGTSKKHCNSATLAHVGGGELSVTKSTVIDATCARVVVRCSGTCERTGK